jgi:hypothetical protein
MQILEPADFGLSFRFGSAIYVDIMSIFKVKNKGKKCLQESAFILFTFPRHLMILQNIITLILLVFQKDGTGDV